MPEEITIKQLPKQWAASIREVIPAYSDVYKLFGTVSDSLGPAMAVATLPFAIWHDREFKAADVDAQAGYMLQAPIGIATGVQVEELPEVTAATTVFKGAYQDLSQAYGRLMHWIASSGYQVSGPARELYIHRALPVRQDDDTYVTELQIPVTGRRDR